MTDNQTESMRHKLVALAGRNREAEDYRCHADERFDFFKSCSVVMGQTLITVNDGLTLQTKKFRDPLSPTGIRITKIAPLETPIDGVALHHFTLTNMQDRFVLLTGGGN